MATEVAAAASPTVGAALSGLGTALSAVVVAHPVTVAAVGGLAIGASAYHAVRTWRAGRKAKANAAPAAEPA